jgi:aspartyl-tRNA(Asn)/glutamyl-tRNA(Gln) amidotransferase subunit A
LARTVEDCVLADMVLRGAVTSGVRRQSVKGLLLVVPESVHTEDVDEAVGERFRAALDALAEAGAVVQWRKVAPLDRFVEVSAAHGSLIAAEAYRTHRALIDGDDVGRVDRRVVARILGGKKLGSLDVLMLQAARVELEAELRGLLGEALLVMPTTAHTAPAIDELEADDELFHRVNLRTLRNTMPANFMGMCALALPSGVDGDGLPTSVSVMAPGGADERLLGVGLEVERVLTAD